MKGELHSRAAANAWVLLRAGSDADGDLSIPTIRSRAETELGPIRFGLAEDQLPRLLLPIHDRMRFNRRWESDFISVASVRLTCAGQSRRFIDIVCRERSLESAFAEVAQAMIDRIELGYDIDKASFDTLEEYRSLFSNEEKPAVDSAVLKGLVGELLVLDQLSSLHPRAIRLWQGPRGDRHDFRGGSLALEVKTSSPSAASIVHISSFEQLVEPSGGELFLVQNIIEPTEGGMLSVSALADSIHKKTESKEDFRALLMALGCEDPKSEQWNSITYRFEAQRAFRVVDGFPRLGAAHLMDRKLPPGVLGLSYDVDLTLAQTWALADDEIDQIKRKLVACL